MAKSAAKPIVTKSGNKFKGPGWDGQKVEPYVPSQPKPWDPKRGTHGISSPG